MSPMKRKAETRLSGRDAKTAKRPQFSITSSFGSPKEVFSAHITPQAQVDAYDHEKLTEQCLSLSEAFDSLKSTIDSHYTTISDVWKRKRKTTRNAILRRAWSSTWDATTPPSSRSQVDLPKAETQQRRFVDVHLDQEYLAHDPELFLATCSSSFTIAYAKNHAQDISSASSAWWTPFGTIPEFALHSTNTGESRVRRNVRRASGPLTGCLYTSRVGQQEHVLSMVELLLAAEVQERICLFLVAV